ncbi:MAG: HPr(Ser) kinase/phosphatase [Gemmatimonadota bacterium]|nr:HPr(Ser) kinase/phosphatase [Gemmatimonadota bacterium]MDH5758704.1 HPr(Ser) kinase/phosphatase [Gemmatimonadota bacterium]
MTTPSEAPSDQDPAGRSITIRHILEAKRETLALELANPGVSLDREANDPDVSSPGLALAGYTARVPPGRMWVFGETEVTYLGTLDQAEARERLARLFSFDPPAVFVTKSQKIPADFMELASAHGIPVLLSGRSTKDVYRRIKPFLEEAMAPFTNLHGSLADVYGVGLLFQGESGIGKSECVLDLVERGHRLVADDLVLATRQGNDILIGRGHELQRHHMEIRGVGIIDIPMLFGVRAIRQQKRIEVVVQLELWDQDRSYSRTGLELDEAEILGVRIPRVTIPLNPGKNITVVSEVIAMNHLLTYAGINSAEAFDKGLKERMAPIREYLEQDYE